MHETNYGPEWLETFGDQMASNDQALGAEPFRQMAKAWNADKQALQDAHDENTRLQARISQVAQAVSA